MHRANEREIWDAKYASGSHGSRVPDPFFLQAYEEFVVPLHPVPGCALDLAGGVGRHALWLAQEKWETTLLDISQYGLRLAGEQAEKHGVRLELVQADLTSFDLGQESFDQILVFFYLQRELFPSILSALKPNGILIYKTYTVEQTRLGSCGPTHPMHLLESNELLTAFSPMQVLYYSESVQDRGIAELVARKK